MDRCPAERHGAVRVRGRVRRDAGRATAPKAMASDARRLGSLQDEGARPRRPPGDRMLGDGVPKGSVGTDPAPPSARRAAARDGRCGAASCRLAPGPPPDGPRLRGPRGAGARPSAPRPARGCARSRRSEGASGRRRTGLMLDARAWSRATRSSGVFAERRALPSDGGGAHCAGHGNQGADAHPGERRSSDDIADVFVPADAFASWPSSTSACANARRSSRTRRSRARASACRARRRDPPSRQAEEHRQRQWDGVDEPGDPGPLKNWPIAGSPSLHASRGGWHDRRSGPRPARALRVRLASGPRPRRSRAGPRRPGARPRLAA